ncbi:MAG: hypothetical protein ACOC6G_01605 [Thermoproteota archaeon]
MSPIVIKVRKDEIQPLKNLLLSRTDVEQLKTTNPYEVFRLKYYDCLIIGYSTGKIVANKKTAKDLFSELLSQITPRQKETVIGSDEAGKGEWLGPMVVAAVAVKPEQKTELKVQGVMDSKELSLTKIRELADFIRDNDYLESHVIIPPEKFNKLFDEFRDEGRTLNDILAWGHSKAIGNLLHFNSLKNRKVKVIIDEFDRIKTQQRIQRVLNLDKVQVIQQPKAEENIAVAAASIIARDLREDYIDFLSKKLQKDLRKVSPDEAILDDKSVEYAKVSYLKN